MKRVVVTFDCNAKPYTYYTKLDLIPGAWYYIETDHMTSYGTPVRIHSIEERQRGSGNYRVITNARCIEAPRLKDDGIKNVYFNEEKGTTVVVWKDGTKTKVRCQNEPFDREKGLAMCYVKRFMNNRGAYNCIFRKWCGGAE